MSRPRYDWWSYVKCIIRRYPAPPRGNGRPTYGIWHGELFRDAGRISRAAPPRQLQSGSRRPLASESMRRCAELSRPQSGIATAWDRLKVIKLVLWVGMEPHA